LTHFWLRAETKPGEARTPLTPTTAQALIDAGHQVSVELAGERCFSNGDFAAVGCEMVPSGGWVFSPDEAVILGIKELPEGPVNLTHKHIHFGHAFKGQPGWQEFLARFQRGGGALYDLENLTDEGGRRLAAFGYRAGYAGAAMGVLVWAGAQRGHSPIIGKMKPFADEADLLMTLRNALEGQDLPTALITGALGRCGTGAKDLLAEIGVEATLWDVQETKGGGPFPEILDHDIFLNCVLAGPGIPVFVGKDALEKSGRKLSVISDVSCDPGSAYNPIPIYDHITSFSEPVVSVGPAEAPIHITAIDHLPSLLPRESSEEYAEQLLSVLMQFDDDRDGVWARAKAVFDAKLGEL
jgi:saccharopine dehydrogenase (NAD+, L-lysine-forming)